MHRKAIVAAVSKGKGNGKRHGHRGVLVGRFHSPANGEEKIGEVEGEMGMEVREEGPFDLIVVAGTLTPFHTFELIAFTHEHTYNIHT